jgi:hypothetical protein
MLQLLQLPAVAATATSISLVRDRVQFLSLQVTSGLA